MQPRVGGGLVAAPEKARLRLRLPSPSVDSLTLRLPFPTNHHRERGMDPSRARQIFNRISTVSSPDFSRPFVFEKYLNYRFE